MRLYAYNPLLRYLRAPAYHFGSQAGSAALDVTEVFAWTVGVLDRLLRLDGDEDACKHECALLLDEVMYGLASQRDALRNEKETQAAVLLIGLSRCLRYAAHYAAALGSLESCVLALIPKLETLNPMAVATEYAKLNELADTDALESWIEAYIAGGTLLTDEGGRLTTLQGGTGGQQPQKSSFTVAPGRATDLIKVLNALCRLGVFTDKQGKQFSSHGGSKGASKTRLIEEAMAFFGIDKPNVSQSLANSKQAANYTEVFRQMLDMAEKDLR